MDQEQKRIQAQHYVAKLKGFYVHLATYVAVNSLLFAINALTSGPWWFYWPLLGWGIGIAMHALGVFGFDRVLGREWEEKKIEELMKR
jgi:2TM domain